MKPTEEKLKFIKLRAEGKSYGTIAKEMNISKDTCSKWERELKEEIAELKGEQLDTLYTTFYMTKEAKIKTLGESLEQINKALEGKNLAEMQPDKLFELKLKYINELSKEFIEYKTPEQRNFFSINNLMGL